MKYGLIRLDTELHIWDVDAAIDEHGIDVEWIESDIDLARAAGLTVAEDDADALEQSIELRKQILKRHDNFDELLDGMTDAPSQTTGEILEITKTLMLINISRQLEIMATFGA